MSTKSAATSSTTRDISLQTEPLTEREKYIYENYNHFNEKSTPNAQLQNDSQDRQVNRTGPQSNWQVQPTCEGKVQNAPGEKKGEEEIEKPRVKQKQVDKLNKAIHEILRKYGGGVNKSSNNGQKHKNEDDTQSQCTDVCSDEKSIPDETHEKKSLTQSARSRRRVFLLQNDFNRNAECVSVVGHGHSEPGSVDVISEQKSTAGNAISDKESAIEKNVANKRNSLRSTESDYPSEISSSQKGDIQPRNRSQSVWTNNIDKGLESKRQPNARKRRSYHPQQEKLDYQKAVSVVCKILSDGYRQIVEKLGSDFFKLFDRNDENMFKEILPTMFKGLIEFSIPFPSGTFKILSGLKHGLKGRDAIYCINDYCLIQEERNAVRNTMSRYLIGSCLSPTKITQNVYKVLEPYFKSLEGDSTIDNCSFLIKTSPNECSITINIVLFDVKSYQYETMSIDLAPSIKTVSRPYGMALTQPFPQTMPYSLIGRAIMQEIEEELYQGKELICLDASLGSYWVTSFRLLETHLLGSLQQQASLKNALIAFSVVEIVRKHNVEWTILTPAVLRIIRLWAIKNAKEINQTEAEWLICILQFISKVFNTGFLRSYFCPTINILANADKKPLETIASDIDTFLENTKEQNKVLKNLFKKAK